MIAGLAGLLASKGEIVTLSITRVTIRRCPHDRVRGFGFIA